VGPDFDCLVVFTAKKLAQNLLLGPNYYITTHARLRQAKLQH
jgi:hypothetical protein